MANPYRDNPEQYGSRYRPSRARTGSDWSRPSEGGGDYGSDEYGNDYGSEREFSGAVRSDRYRNYDAQIERDENSYRYWRNHYGGEPTGDYSSSAGGDRAGRERYARDLGRERERFTRLNRSAYGNRNYGPAYDPHAPYNQGDFYGRDRYAGYGSQRDWWDRTRDEVASWFGDDAAELRREMDHARDEYSGRGPKNYKRSDERILEDVNDRLTGNSSLDAHDIEVLVKDGEVTLNGAVSGRYAKRQAEDIAHDVSGVKHVQNNLRFKERDAQNAAKGIGSSATVGNLPAGSSGGNGRNAH